MLGGVITNKYAKWNLQLDKHSQTFMTDINAVTVIGVSTEYIYAETTLEVADKIGVWFKDYPECREVFV